MALLPAKAYGSPVTELPAPDIGPDGAFIDCPCIDHVDSGSSWAQALQARGLVLASGELGTHLGPVERSYGSTQCRAFDGEGRRGPYFVCNEPEPRSWCGEPWCYVDPANCSPLRSPQPSQLLPGFHYSFPACGSVDQYRYNESAIAQSLAPIYVNARGFDVFAGPRTSLDRLEDVIIEFSGDVLQHLGFSRRQVTYRALSPGSVAAHNSSYTACVRDIAVGHLDICAGAYWDTAERRALGVPFASTLISENIFLYAPLERLEVGFWSMVLKPTKAFSPALWGLIVAVLVASGLVLAVLERRVPDGDFDGFSRPGKLLHGLYLAGASFMNGGLSFTPQTAAGKVFSLGLGFFVLIAIASFTANTASILVAEQRAPPVEDLATALSQGRRVCAPSGLRRTLGVVHPLFDTLGVFSDYGIDGYMAGSCELLVAPEFAVQHFQSRGQICELSLVGHPLLSFPTGIFVSERLRVALDTGLAEKRADGTWYLLEEALHSRDRCPGRAAGTAESMELEVQHMTGNCILLGFSLGVAIVLRALQHVEATESVRNAEHRAIDGAAETLHTIECRAAGAAETLHAIECCATGPWGFGAHPTVANKPFEDLEHGCDGELRQEPGAAEGDELKAPCGGGPGAEKRAAALTKL